jgi:predicted kinase
VLIVLSGLPVTGKSAIADAVGRARRLPVLSVDLIESAIIQADIEQGFETGLAPYLVAEALADGFIAAGLDVVIDAVNSTEYARDLWRELALKHDTQLRTIVCILSDPAIHRARLASRERGFARGEPTLDDVEERRSEWTAWPEPHLTLDAIDNLDANVAEALNYLAGPPNSS